MADSSLSLTSHKINLGTKSIISEQDENVDTVDGFRKFIKKQFKSFFFPTDESSDPELTEDFTENKSSRSSRKEKSPTKASNMSDLEGDEYNFSYPKRGLAVIINNEDFSRSKEFGDRPGSSYDASSLYHSFKALGFDVLLFHDLPAWKMVEVLRSAINDYDHSQADCFACSILTHGDQTWSEKEWDRMGITVRLDLLFGTDGKALATKAVVEMFNDDNCPKLKNKPRFFFLQACRGDKYDDGQEILVQKPKPLSHIRRLGEGDSRDSPTSCSDRVRSDQTDSANNTSIPTQRLADVLLLADNEDDNDKDQTNSNLVSDKNPSPPAPSSSSGSLRPQRQISLSSSVDPPEYEQRRIDAVDAKRGGDNEPGATDKTDALWSSVTNVPVSPAPLYQDCLIMYATPPGHFAWRRKTGAWFIQCLCKLFDSNVLEHISFLRGLSYVCGKVAREYQSENPNNPSMHHKKEVPVIESMLIKDVFMKRKLHATPRSK